MGHAIIAKRAPQIGTSPLPTACLLHMADEIEKEALVPSCAEEFPTQSLAIFA